MTSIETAMHDCERIASDFTVFCSDGKFTREDIPDLARDLISARRAARAMSDTARHLEGAIAELMDGKVTTIEGVGVLEKRWSPAKTQWEHDELARRVAALSRDERHFNEDTGEIEPEAEACARVLLACAGISYWRKTALKERGLDPREFCESDGGRYSIQVTAP